MCGMRRNAPSAMERLRQIVEGLNRKSEASGQEEYRELMSAIVSAMYELDERVRALEKPQRGLR